MSWLTETHCVTFWLIRVTLCVVFPAFPVCLPSATDPKGQHRWPLERHSVSPVVMLLSHPSSR